VPEPPQLDTASDEASLVRYRIAGLVFMAVLIAAFPLYRIGEPARRAEAREAMREENVALGRELYALHCASCHGKAGRGGRTAPTLAAKEFLKGVSDEQMRWLIAAGSPGTAMPAYDIDHGGPLTGQDIAQVVEYLRSLEADAPSVPGWRKGAAAEPVSGDEKTPGSGPDAAGREAAGASVGRVDDAGSDGDGRDVGPKKVRTPSPDGAVATTDARDRATGAYAAHCAACHGPEGGGTEIAGPVRPLPPALRDDPEALARIIREGVPGTSMQAFGRSTGGPLKPSTIEALVRWLRTPDASSDASD